MLTHYRSNVHCPPRTLVALGYLVSGQAVNGLVELERLTLVTLHAARLDVRWRGRALRLTGFRGSRIAHGVQWGGPGHVTIQRNLRLGLRRGIADRRGHSAGSEWKDLAAALERRLRAAARGWSRRGWTQFRLPRLWAGFAPQDAVEMYGAGPELEAASQRRRLLPQTLFRRATRAHLGLVLYPMDWVSHAWTNFRTAFAALETFPQIQVIRLHDPATDLVGHYGAAGFDFRGGVSPPVPPKHALPVGPAFWATAQPLQRNSA
ncbi:MAG: hypothetical protein ACYC35_29225 [Pirellulales bacterium]